MITGINIDKVEAVRSSTEAIANMRFNINFDDVKVEQDNVNVSFTFSTVYEGSNAKDEVGHLTIVGKIVSKESKKDTDDITNTWKNKKTLPIQYAENIINLLNFECSARGTLAAYAIGFVAPLPLTRAKLQETPENPSGA